MILLPSAAALVGCHGRDRGGDDDDDDVPIPVLTVECLPTDNPLRMACDVTVDPPAPVELRAARRNGSGERVVRGDEVAADHALTVVFLSALTTYEVTVTGADGGSATTSFVTGDLPDSARAFLSVTGESSTPWVGANLPCTANVATAAVFDTATGDLVWYQQLEDSGSLTGYNMAQFTEDHTVIGLTGSTVHEVDLNGATLLRKEYTRRFNHDLFRRDGLTWLIYSDDVAGATLQGIAVWDAAGREVADFFMSDLWPLPDGVLGDWSHTNSVWVNPSYEGWLSLYGQNSIVKIDADPESGTFGELEWVLGGSLPMGLGQDFEVDWSAVDGRDGFVRQHAASFASDGSLLFLDNGSARGLVVTLDEGARTARVAESYVAGDISCGPQGTTGETASGHLLVGCSGWDVDEYERGGSESVWRGVLECGPHPPVASLGVNRWYPLDGW